MHVMPLLPAGNYVVKYDKMHMMFFLEQINDFEMPSKIYGNTERLADRITKTFFDRKGSTGVLLAGEKGSGKTLLSKFISHKLAKENNVPTVIINESFSGEEFNVFLNTIEQPTVVVFDEFEKTYNFQEQQKLLTVLEGIYSHNKLFLVTCNDFYSIDRHMVNRPGRFYYSMFFGSCDDDFITEYCNDRLNDKDKIESIVRIAKTFSAFTFDILKTIVEEMNRYGEDVYDAIHFLNAKPDFGKSQTYKVEILHKNVNMIKPHGVHPKEIRNVNILEDGFTAWLDLTNDQSIGIDEETVRKDGVFCEDKEEGEIGWFESQFTPADIITFSKDGEIVYKKGDYQVILSRQVKNKIDFRAI